MINRRGIYILSSFFFSIIMSYQWGILLKESVNTISALIDVFSILAGVLVAVISIIGDPSMLLSGNWRVGWEHAQEMQRRISNYSNLFVIYILTLILLVTCNIVKDNSLASFDVVFSIASGFAIFALLLSIPLPYGLMSIQKERMKEEVNERKNKAKNRNGNNR